MITGIYAGIAAIMLVYLSLRVVGQRRRNKVSIGTGGNPDVERAIRVHGNFVEYTPIMLLILGFIETGGFAPAGVHALGALIIIMRISHFMGISTQAAPAIFRMVGAAGTFLLLLILGVIAIAQNLGVLI